VANGRPRVRDPERRERILLAATDLIARHGYLGVSLGEIGAAAGIVGSGIYRHFDNKSGILVELFDRVVDHLVADAESDLGASTDPVATLRMLVAGHVRFTMDELLLCRVYLQEAHNLPGDDQQRLRQKQRTYVGIWRDVLCAARPGLLGAQAQALVHAAIAAIHSVLHFRPDLTAAETSALLATAAERVLGIDRTQNC
jgi:AcrR family transcriptional regulator